MKRPVTVVTIAVLLAGLILLGIGDTRISIADNTSVPDNEVASSKANNASATATITITMPGILNE